MGVCLTLAKTSVTSDVYIGGVRNQPLSDWLSERLKGAGLRES
jgi:hypothetical protein